MDWPNSLWRPSPEIHVYILTNGRLIGKGLLDTMGVAVRKGPIQEVVYSVPGRMIKASRCHVRSTVESIAILASMQHIVIFLAALYFTWGLFMHHCS
jgi:hypothetical protein